MQKQSLYNEINAKICVGLTLEKLKYYRILYSLTIKFTKSFVKMT